MAPPRGRDRYVLKAVVAPQTRTGPLASSQPPPQSDPSTLSRFRLSPPKRIDPPPRGRGARHERGGGGGAAGLTLALQHRGRRRRRRGERGGRPPSAQLGQSMQKPASPR